MSVLRISALVSVALAAAVATAAPSLAADDTALRLANVSAANTAYVRVPNDAAFALQTFTLEAWVQRLGAGYGQTTDVGGAGILAKPHEGSTGSNLVSWHLDWTNAGQIVFNLVHTLGSSGLYLSTPAVATPLARHHLAATFDGSMVRLYVDGALSASAPWSLGTVYYGADDVLIGANNFGVGYLRRFDGRIDDVRVWNRARTDSEIAASMNCRLSGTEPGLVAYWPFDNSDLADQSGHGHGGAAVGTSGSLSYASLAPLGSCLTGVRDLAERGEGGLDLSLFPQPARDRLTVDFALAEAGDARVEVLDVAGRKLAEWGARSYSSGRHRITVDLRDPLARAAANGVLFVRVRAGEQTAVRTLVVRR